MDENTYRRVMSRNIDDFSTPANNSNSAANSPSTSFGGSVPSSMPGNRMGAAPGNYYTRTMSSDYSSDYGRKKNNINLKQIKTVGLNCAKNLTNKLISLSNTAAANYNARSNVVCNSTSAGSNSKYSCSSKEVYIINSQTNNPQNTPNYGTTSSNYGPNSNNVYSLRNIANRIDTTNDPVRTHRELVAVIEHILTHNDYLIEITIEKDKFGAPTMDSINRFTLINKKLLPKILEYISGRRDCCVFVVKFITWKMRNTRKPEEVILSLELLAHCMEHMGGYFLSMFTKSLMKTLRKMLFATNLKHSITSDVKKKITKLLGKSNYIHPGVSTDIRIHIFKSKILYLVQLYYEVFLFEQGEYVVFYDGYKDMRMKGIKFPKIKPEDKGKINKAYRFAGGRDTATPYSTSAGNEALYAEVNIDLNELNELLQNINSNNYNSAYINGVRNKLLHSIDVLSNRGQLNEEGAMLLDKILRLNDSLLMLIENNYHSDSHIKSRLETIIRDDGQKDEWEEESDWQGEGGVENLLELNTSSIEDDAFDVGAQKDKNKQYNDIYDVDNFFNTPGPANTSSANDNLSSVKDNLDDIFNYISQGNNMNTAFSPAVVNPETEDEELKARFGVAVDEDMELSPEKKSSKLFDDDDSEYSEDEDELINNFINDKQFGFERKEAVGTEPAVEADNPAPNPEVGGEPAPEAQLEEEPAAPPTEKDKSEQNLSKMLELDNLEVDFGHMSINNF